MPTFAAIKIHYDHRSSLAPHLKYSIVPGKDEYAEYSRLYHEDGVGGNGFHECVNFAVGESDTVQFYLPPTCIPGTSRQDDEFVFFSFTYKGDQELSAHVVGVHAGACIVNGQGEVRRKPAQIDGIEPLVYHAEAPADLVTLITPTLAYDVRDGVYTPVYQSWGYGRRYIDENHAANIIRDAVKQAARALDAAGESERVALQRQIEVLRRISDRYGLGVGKNKRKKTSGMVGSAGMPDTEIGYRGERFVYERELDYVKSIGRDASEVEWMSQVVPTSPFDIRTLRKTSNGVQQHFIEVKTSGMEEGENVYISSGQIEFFEQNRNCATFALVNFGAEKKPSYRELTLDELNSEFHLQAVKFKLARRG
ncbi:protein NO VEIN domain-containing protein [Burkholderia pseudomallei]